MFALLIGPILLGAICGWLLGVTETGYTILTTLAVVGGVAAGYEHTTPRSGALRGLWGGAMFGLAICEVHRLIGVSPTAEVPDPVEIVIIFFSLIGCALGAIGAYRRGKRELRHGV